MRLPISIMIALCVVVSLAGAQEGALSLEDARKVAAESLQTLRTLVTKDNFRSMGFTSPGEAGEARLGVPFREDMVRLDELRKYAPGTNPEKLLSSLRQVIYPVEAKEEARSAIVVAEVDGRLKTVSMGGANYIGQLARARKEIAIRTRQPLSSFSTVRVPALNVRFLAYREEGRLMLMPLLDAPEFGFKAGVSVTAEKAFAAMQPAAMEHDGLPR